MPRACVGTIVPVCVGRTDLEAFRLTPHATQHEVQGFLCDTTANAIRNQCQGVRTSRVRVTYTHPYHITSAGD